LREELFEQIELICPRCRQAGHEGIVQSPLELGQVFSREGEFVLEGFLDCSNDACGGVYPILQGVPVILKDVGAWWRSEKTGFSCVKSPAPEIREYFDGLDFNAPYSLADRNLLSAYMDLHYGEVGNKPDQLTSFTDSGRFWDTAVGMTQPESGTKYSRSLDLGCSVGRYTFELAQLSDLAVGIDLNFNAVSSAARFHRIRKISYERRKHGRAFEETETSYSPPQNILFFVADSLDPPFRADAFDLVAGLNLVDNVKLPLVLIGQMNALLGECGTLILGAPYEWRTDISEPLEWLENDALDAPDMVRQILEGNIFPQMQLKYEVLQEFFDLPWALRHHDRYWSLFLVHLIKAQKII
jgi:SAM-dependent methyltransferase/uncharacterized protein YbaR (Trm112 family)